MFGRLRSPLRHPFYPDLPATPAAAATGCHAVVAGRFEDLAEAAARGVQATHAVFLLRDQPAEADDEGRRDALWKWFQVPSFVLVLDASGRPAAYECEAREGLHIPAPSPLEACGTALCPCGRPGARLKVQPATECSDDALQPVRQY